MVIFNIVMMIVE